MRRPLEHGMRAYWGDIQNNRLLELIESGEINPNTTDGTALYNYTVTYFNGFQGEEGSATGKANAIARLRKKFRNYLFDGTIKGTRKRSAAQGIKY